MTLKRTDVENIAHLARIAVTEQELNDYATELSQILNLVETMNKTETSTVLPMSHPLHMVQRLRADEVLEQGNPTEFQKIAPATADGYYLVPKVID